MKKTKNKTQIKKELAQLQEIYAKRFYEKMIDKKIFNMRRIIKKFKCFFFNSQYTFDIEYKYLYSCRIIFQKNADVKMYITNFNDTQIFNLKTKKNIILLDFDIDYIISFFENEIENKINYEKPITSIKNKDIFTTTMKQLIPFYFCKDKKYQIIELKRASSYVFNQLYILKKEEVHNKIIYIKDFKIKQPEITIKQNDLIIVNELFNESEISTSGLQKSKAKKIFKEYILK